MPDENPTSGQPSIHNSLGYWVTLLARTMEAELNRRLTPFGVTRFGWAVLGAIHFDGQKTPSALSSFLKIDPAAITRILDQLENKDLIDRQRTTKDRRAITLSLTNHGEKLTLEIARESARVNEMFLAGINADEKAVFIDTARKILKNGTQSVGKL